MWILLVGVPMVAIGMYALGVNKGVKLEDDKEEDKKE